MPYKFMFLKPQNRSRLKLGENLVFFESGEGVRLPRERG